MTTNKVYELDTNNCHAVLAYNASVETNRNIFLTGGAGTGKTSLIKHIINTTKKKTLVLAPTGVAANNINGSTIHRFFSLPNFLLVPGSNYKIGKGIGRKNEQIIRELELLIIDEVSMLRCDILDTIDSNLKLIRENDLPMGGVQIIFVGDLYQLPPVVNKEEKEKLKWFYSSPYFFDANIVKKLDLVKIELRKNYRQNDREFILTLNSIRKGYCTQEDIDYFNTRYFENGRENIKNSEFSTVLTLSNKKANEMNEEIFREIEGSSFTHKAMTKGEWTKNDYPANLALYLKEGCKVIITHNSHWGSDIQNGMMARVLYNNYSYDTIKLKFENGMEANLKRKVWKSARGTFEQFPLSLAYALTVHKSQGLTLGSVILDLSNGFCSQGLLYVALSRVKKLEDLILLDKIKLSDVKVDSRVIYFSRDVNDETILAKLNEEILSGVKEVA